MKVSEMLGMLENDKTLEFDLKHPHGNSGKVGMRIHKDYDRLTVCWTQDNCVDKIFPINDYTMQYECKLVEKPVTFMEAINSGKNIKNNNMIDFRSATDIHTRLCNLTHKDFMEEINGKWYIKQ